MFILNYMLKLSLYSPFENNFNSVLNFRQLQLNLEIILKIDFLSSYL